MFNKRFLLVFLLLIISAVQVSALVNTSGNITYVLEGTNNWTIVTCYNACTYNVTENMSVQILLVGGGGSGGSATGGGGGAGGVIYNTSFNIPIGNYSIIIGAGGIGNTVGGNNGTASSFNNSLIALGGGQGGDNSNRAGSGGCGGGASVNGAYPQVGVGSQGFNGGLSYGAGVCFGAGGGGGVSSDGTAGTSTIAGNAGNGTSINISGSYQNYSFGGAGCSYDCSQVCGIALGGGGTGAFGNATSYGSAGAGSIFNLVTAGGRGKQGIVIIRYLTPILDNINFVSQTPSDLTAVSLFTNYSLNITYMYNVSLLNASTVALSSKITSDVLPCIQVVNGTCNLLNNTYFNTTSSYNLSGSGFNNYTFSLRENDVYSYITNLAGLNFMNNVHSNFTSNNVNTLIATRLDNVSNKTQFNVFEIMATSTGNAKVYACNNSYNFVSVVSTNANCQEIGSIGDTYQHIHNANSSHNIVPFSIVNGRLSNGVYVTPTMYFIVAGQNGQVTKVSYVNIFTADGVISTGTGAGTTWTNQTYTVDSHLHQYSNTELLIYFGKANYNNTLSTSLSSSDLIDVTGLNPQSPIITSPLNTIQSSRFLNISYLNATPVVPSTTITNYSIFLLNNDLSFNQTIIGNNSLNNSYVFDIYSRNLSIGNYFVKVVAIDNLGNTALDIEGFNLTRDGLLNITAWNGSVSLTTFTVNLTDLNTSEYFINLSSNNLSTFNVIKGHTYNILIDAPGYAYDSTNITINSSFSSYNALMFDTNSLTITIVNELNSSIITQLITMTAQSPTVLNNYSTSTGYLNISGIPVGDFELTFTSTNYVTRTYQITINNRTHQTLTARLLANNVSIAVGIYTKSQTFQVLPFALITIQRQFPGGSFATILQGVTDVSGFITFNLQSGVNYKVILEATGYITKEFNQQFYLANSPYTFILTDTGSAPYVNVLDGVSYFYSPTNSTLINGTYTFLISTYNASFTIAWTAVNTNGTITQVVGSPGGSTASNTVDLSHYNGVYPVIYSFNYYDPNTATYLTYEIPINYWIGSPPNTNTSIVSTLTDLKASLHANNQDGWLAILSVFIILTAVLTIVQLSQNMLAGVGVGFATMIFLAFIGWLPGMLVAMIVIISGFLLFMERQY